MAGDGCKRYKRGSPLSRWLSRSSRAIYRHLVAWLRFMVGNGKQLGGFSPPQKSYKIWQMMKTLILFTAFTGSIEFSPPSVNLSSSMHSVVYSSRSRLLLKQHYRFSMRKSRSTLKHLCKIGRGERGKKPFPSSLSPPPLHCGLSNK